MTDETSPDEPQGAPTGMPKGAEFLARFLQDWTALWRDELQAQARDPEGVPPGMFPGMQRGGVSPDMSAAVELARAAMTVWAETLGASPSSMVRSRDRSAPPRTEAAAAASDARDAEVERLARRVDELEARLAKLETPRRRRG
jgi:hypothetical protein